MRTGTALAIVVIVAAAAVATGCGGSPARSRTGAVASASNETMPNESTPADGQEPLPGSPSSSPQASWTPGSGAPERTTALLAYLRRLPGSAGMVVRDTSTGQVWRAGAVSHPAWTASTIKVAIAVDILERQRAGRITLTAADHANLRAMLVESSNEATDSLWERYDGVGMLQVFKTRLGMSGLAVVSGYRAYWRHLQCTTEDLAAVMAYALTRLDQADRAYLVDMSRAAATRFPWGVPAAGAGQQPGHKPGWAFKPEGRPDHWVTHSVGFTGQGERYVLAVMFDQPPSGTLRSGVQAISDLVALAFDRSVPAPIRVP